MSLDVVVLPLVPVMTIDPFVRSAASLVRMLGSIALATSPGRVVPPPRLVTRLRAPVALPAQTAAVLRMVLVVARMRVRARVLARVLALVLVRLGLVISRGR